MAKDDIIELTGSVEEVLPGSMFRVKVGKHAKYFALLHGWQVETKQNKNYPR